MDAIKNRIDDWNRLNYQVESHPLIKRVNNFATMSKLIITTVYTSLIIIAVITIFISLCQYLTPQLFILNYYNKPLVKSVQLTKFDLFNPVFSTILFNGNEGYLVIVDTYKRDNLLFWKSATGKDRDYAGYEIINAKIENKTLEQVQDILAKNDLSKVNPDVKNITSNGNIVTNTNPIDIKNQEAEKPENFYYDYINTKDTTQNSSKLTIDKFFGIKQTTTYGNLLDKNIGGDVGTPFADKNSATKMPESNYNLNHPNINFVAIGFNKTDPNSYSFGRDSTVAKIVLVMNDRSFVEIPTKPDGTFDFEAVKSKWE